jgi:hypothetical protein
LEDGPTSLGAAIAECFYDKDANKTNRYICIVHPSVQFLAKHRHKKQVSGNHKGFSNLTDHAKRWHNPLYQKFKTKYREAATLCSLHRVVQDFNLAKVSAGPSQMTLEESLSRAKRMAPNTLMANISFLIRDIRLSHSFLSTEDPYLRTGFAALNFDSKRLIGSRKQNSDMIPLLFAHTLKMIYGHFTKECVPAISFTADSWTCHNHHKFIGLTCHFVTNDMTLASYVMEVVRFDDEQTIEALATHFQQRLSVHFPRTRIFAGTVDGGSNFQGAVRAILQLEFARVHCVAHVLNLCVEDFFKIASNSELLKDINSLKLAIESSHSMYLAFEKSCLTRHQVRGFIDASKTRWGTQLDVLARVKLLKPVLFEFARSNPSLPVQFINEALFSKLERILEATKSVSIMLNDLQSQSAFTISTVAPRLASLLHSLEEQSKLCDDETCHPAYQVGEILMTRLGCILEIANPTLLASALDPRYCRLDFVTNEVRGVVSRALVFLLAQIDSTIPEEGLMAMVASATTNMDTYYHNIHRHCSPNEHLDECRRHDFVAGFWSSLAPNGTLKLSFRIAFAGSYDLASCYSIHRSAENRSTNSILSPSHLRCFRSSLLS